MKIMFCKTSQFSWKSICDGVPLEKAVSPHVRNCTKKNAITGVFLWIAFGNTSFLVHFTQAFVRTGYRKTPVPEFFLLDKVAHYQACKFNKKRLQQSCFTVNFAKLLKVPCRTPPVSASDFSATLLTLRPRKTYICVFPALLFYWYF